MSSKREGSLEAPTRHALDWQSDSFHDEPQLFEELERVFDICHGCRRCFNLCHSFPTLFDAVDESESMELDTVPKKVYWDVVDHCYLCDMCYMSKGPYVPPHEWNVDFPHLMLRAKATRFKQQGASKRDRILSATDTVGKRLRSRRNTSGDDAIATENTNGKVVLYTTCYGNRNLPTMDEDLVAVFEHNGIPVALAEKETCCGMPKLELGDLDAVASAKEINIPILAAWVDKGWDIVAPIPSCTLMFKQELPLMFPEDAEVLKVRDAMFDPFEYLMLRHKAGKLNTEFTASLGQISYQVPCHLRVQNIGLKTRDILQLVPDTAVAAIERCSGHDGTYAVKKEFHDISKKIARPVVNKVKKGDADHFISDCPMAAEQIAQGLDDHEAEHPMGLLRQAYGI
jgi:Fe-S oxidoreductase